MLGVLLTGKPILNPKSCLPLQKMAEKIWEVTIHNNNCVSGVNVQQEELVTFVTSTQIPVSVTPVSMAPHAFMRLIGTSASAPRLMLESTVRYR